MFPTPAPRPAIATFFGVVSLIWATITLSGTLLGIVIFAVVGAGSWLAGPLVGAIGSAISVVVILYLILASLLSFVLLRAGWLTMQGDPRGIDLLRLWAWISLVLDALSLLLSGGLAANGYFGLVYAVAVLYYTTPLEIKSRWDTNPHQMHYGKPKPASGFDPDFS